MWKLDKHNFKFLIETKIGQFNKFAYIYNKLTIQGKETKSPLFFYMSLRLKVENLLSEKLDENPSLFLIELKIGIDNSINVILDGDNGVTLNDCVKISRFIEHQLDRDNKDFSIEVTSSGVGNPLKNSRQFLNNVGRKLKVELLNGSSLQGLLDAADDFGFTLKWKQREPKPIGKGKITVEKKEKLSYNEVIKTIVLV